MPPIPKAPPSLHDPKLLSRTHAATPGDEIVISGISGKFPNSENVEEFAENLYNKVSFSNFISFCARERVRDQLISSSVEFQIFCMFAIIFILYILNSLE